MSKQLDPKKALYLKPNQHTLPGRKPRKQRKSDWQPQNGDYALDPWGVAIRALRERGVLAKDD
jgi:hypothetical protein